MFEKFKSKKEESGNNYPKEVTEIHHEFETAAEKLLNEAKEHIAEAEKKDVHKVKRLLSFGFRQASQVAETQTAIQKAELFEEQMKLVNYYSLKYPNNKFITEKQVSQICHKYNLVCGAVSRFKGFVPEKNLREIEAFKLKEEDRIKFLFQITGRLGTNKQFPLNEIDESYLTEYGKEYFSDKSAIRYAYITDDSASFAYTSRSYSNPLFNSKCVVFNGFQYVRADLVDADELQICAPVKDMDLSGMTIADGYKVIKHIPDPVVLQRVKGGYLILTAWGDEASDEIVVNQKFN